MWSFSGVSGLGDFPHLQILPSGVQVGQKDVKYENINDFLIILSPNQLLGLNNYVIFAIIHFLAIRQHQQLANYIFKKKIKQI